MDLHLVAAAELSAVVTVVERNSARVGTERDNGDFEMEVVEAEDKLVVEEGGPYIVASERDYRRQRRKIRFVGGFHDVKLCAVVVGVFDDWEVELKGWDRRVEVVAVVERARMVNHFPVKAGESMIVGVVEMAEED